MKLFHISEERDIKVFKPRPSPSLFDNVTGDVVFGISEELLHNYLLPRDCPRVCFCKNEDSTGEDGEIFFVGTNAKYVMAVEAAWWPTIKDTVLYRYEFNVENFSLIDACAGYYVSYETEEPITVTVITDVVAAITQRNVELRFVPNLWKLHDAVKRSSLSFSMIRMRNAIVK